VASPARADVITQWNFNSVPPDGNLATGTTIPSIGTGTASLVGGTTGSFASGVANGGSTDPAPTDNTGWQTTTYPAQGAGNLTAGVQFLVSTAGFENIVVSWDQRHSNTASRFAQFQYTTDGTTFTSFGPPFAGTAGDTWFNNRTIDLTGIPGVADNPLFGFRILAAFDPNGTGYVASNTGSTYAPGGTWRFDMVTVSGAAQIAEVPAPPAVVVFAGLAGVALVRRRRV
jgi:hypothetical protein